MNESCAPGTTTGQRGNGRPIPNASTLSFVLALVAVLLSLTWFNFVPSGDPPFYFGLKITEDLEALPSIISTGDFATFFSFVTWYALPILLAVFIKVFGKSRQWMVLTPIAMYLAITLIWILLVSLQNDAAYFFDNLSVLFALNIPYIAVHGITFVVALVCALTSRPTNNAILGFVCVTAIGAVFMVSGQDPFGCIDEQDSTHIWYVSSFLRYTATLASTAVFIVNCDRSGLTPLLTMRAGASARHGGTARGAAGADTPSKDLDAIDEIRKLKVLLDAGAISAEEYDKKKKELLERIGT